MHPTTPQPDEHTGKPDARALLFATSKILDDPSLPEAFKAGFAKGMLQHLAGDFAPAMKVCDWCLSPTQSLTDGLCSECLIKAEAENAADDEMIRLAMHHARGGR